MKYRALGRTGIRVSEIGLGCEHLEGKDYSTVKKAIDEAFLLGINIFDVFMSEPNVRTNIGKALKGNREKAIIQGHIGAIWKNGQYALSRDINECKEAFEDLLTRLDTNYIDIGMLHYVDTEESFDGVFNGEIISYAKELKEKGIIKTIGLSSHVAEFAKRAVETDLIDVLMFSLNPAFDLMPSKMSLDDIFEEKNTKTAMQNQIDPERMDLYHTCKRHGTAITVMKAYMAGRLLSAKQSPFGVAMTEAQCIHYALSRPSVASALIGCITPLEMHKAVAYETATDKDKDFSEVLKKNFTVKGKCVYCNHCLPCPEQIDVAQVNKFLDLASASEQIPATVREHYNSLSKHAGDCTACRGCESRCPFEVNVSARMKEAVNCFGK